MSVTGLVLAAGAGRRMGGPKALLTASVGGRTFVETAVAQLYAAGLTRVVVVTGAAGEDVGAVAQRAGAQVVPCPQWTQGMGACLRAGLAWVQSCDPDADAVLVTLVDLPDVAAPVHRRVLGVLEAGSGTAERSAVLARAAYHGVPGHPVLMGRDHFDSAADSAIGDRGARDYLATRPVILVECSDLATGADVDTPGELSSR